MRAGCSFRQNALALHLKSLALAASVLVLEIGRARGRLRGVVFLGGLQHLLLFDGLAFPASGHGLSVRQRQGGVPGRERWLLLADAGQQSGVTLWLAA